MQYGREFDAPDDFVETSEGSGQMKRVTGAKRGELLRVPDNIRPKQPIQKLLHLPLLQLLETSLAANLNQWQMQAVVDGWVAAVMDV